MGYGYYQPNGGQDSTASEMEYQMNEEIENEFLQNYNDPIIDKFLTYLQQVYLESHDVENENARSFTVSFIFDDIKLCKAKLP